MASEIVRVTSPADIREKPRSDHVLTVLPAGAAVTVIGECGEWVRIKATAGSKIIQGYLEKSKTTWQPAK